MPGISDITITAGPLPATNTRLVLPLNVSCRASKSSSGSNFDASRPEGLVVSFTSSARHLVQEIDVAHHTPGQAHHLRIGAIDDEILVGRMGTAAMAEAEMGRGQAHRTRGENRSGPRAGA